MRGQALIRLPPTNDFMEQSGPHHAQALPVINILSTRNMLARC
jgi:hypothetical protein